ncbi:hypothetical protein F9995_08890 [Bacteroides salyersiae]|jgi:hypothetical protein|uniref:glycosyl hydrolase family 95 catalytic domain-containing protein n=1 Tax=Bacteroides salyersiae TaxID=291644 RepID=UPI00125E830A|nr:glycoside hydrolase N-terminal domain-containing protein [Bacteroides salyersiae]KAB5348918.1 hypothetical protein GAA62_05405 [Bacteroides salyersiae]KAB5352126.1 hypothetical protein GAA37_16475 [Bacteroides salyersiae]KAB5356209.1 hypothetical protein F9967_19185 [Bacteroides salyersiae]KAB5368504.1 hypothetical protein GAA00_10700 [Bacteroides salyersiae]KAB5376084.1 hypothetical protein F9993_07280 [Bacteroides salyersiae]
MKHKLLLFVLLTASLPLFATGSIKERLSPNETLWFTYPARNWSEQALHIGNGYMGASFYGDVEKERFDIAEKTFWTGGPHSVPDFNYGVVKGGKDKIAAIRRSITDRRFAEADSLSRLYMVGDYTNYGYFSMVGNLFVDFGKKNQPVQNYLRGIDLSTSRGFVEYTQGDVRFNREYFCSYPDKLMALHFTANQKGKISFSLSHSLVYQPEKVTEGKDELIFNGIIQGNGLGYTIRMKVLHQGGSIKVGHQQITVEGADEATVFYTVDTEYSSVYPLYKGEKPRQTTEKTIKSAITKGYETVKHTHISDYQTLYNRVKFTLSGDTASEKLPTDIRVKQLQQGFTDDASLKVLWFNLSRYLLISASRPGTLPSNLQGVWNTFEKAPWNGNFQSNINLQEMYWGCGPTQLPECEEAYLEWIEGLVEPGRKTAGEYYGTKGWVSHSTGNIWGHTVPGDDILWGLYPSGAAWHCRHLWEHYAFGGDKSYLETKGYPIMKEAAEFWLENMVEYQKHFIIAPSVSAEHGIEMKNGSPVDYSTANGEQTAGRIFTLPAYQDIEMVYDLYTHVIKASECLGIDSAFREKVAIARNKLLPLKIGRYGQLQEWIDDVDNPRDHHRHIAHLYALYPGNMISYSQTPALALAVKKSLEMRGKGKFGERWPHTGGNWSMAWRTALWTRLYEGDQAIGTFNQMIKESGYENMMSNQSGNMQVDATMATSGLFAEMLLQSQEGFIHLLPALPTEWPEGKIEGLMARNGYRVNMEWKYGKLMKAEIILPHKADKPMVKVQGSYLPESDNRVVLIQATGINN